jgi:hypothetical protein
MVAGALRPTRLIGALALLFAAAQFLVAAHAAAAPDELLSHAPQGCEICLAGAVADDPGALRAAVPAPPALSECAGAAIPARAPRAADLQTAKPRGPPHF